MIKNISQDKAQCERDAMALDDASKKNQDNINNLCNELNCLKIKNQNQNNELNCKNIELNNNKKCITHVIPMKSAEVLNAPQNL